MTNPQIILLLRRLLKRMENEEYTISEEFGFRTTPNGIYKIYEPAGYNTITLSFHGPKLIPLLKENPIMSKPKRLLPQFEDLEAHIQDDDYSGWCTHCGDWTHDSCEPDASEYECPVCENPTCYGAEELLITFMGM